MEEPKIFAPVIPSKVKMLQEAVKSFSSHLDWALPALEYRGITEATANTFGLGVVGNDAPPGFEQYKGKLSIPYVANGQVVQIRFRCLEGMPRNDHAGHDCKALGHGKYLTMPGDHARMYNVDVISRAGLEISCCEGEMDCMILNQLGIPAVAMPGATQWQWRHTILLSGFSRVYVWSDPDAAGHEMRDTIMSHLSRAVPVQLDFGDVTDTYCSLGEDFIRDLHEREV